MIKLFLLVNSVVLLLKDILVNLFFGVIINVSWFVWKLNLFKLGIFKILFV